MALTLSGNLNEKPFTDIVSVLQLQKATGTLTCGAGSAVRSVYVKGGQIIFATSTVERDRLGEVMVAAGKISRSQLERALSLHQKSAGLKKIGAIFVESGYVTPKDLFNGLKLQVRSIIRHLFLMTEGPYQFDERMPAEVIPLQINMEELLREIVEQMKQGK